jgi:hypothetical protein
LGRGATDTADFDRVAPYPCRHLRRGGFVELLI